jgi:hypothetical protein
VNISDESWAKAVRCATSCLEKYAVQGKLSTSAERYTAVVDVLNHAVGLLQLDEYCACPEAHEPDCRNGGV